MYVCICTKYVPDAYRERKIMLEAMELEPLVVVSHSVLELNRGPL